MDKHNIYSVFDSKAEAYLPPYFAANDAMAHRMFQSAAISEDHIFHMHAGDFTLFHIGTFDSLTGQIAPANAFTNLGTALQALSALKAKEQT